MLKVVYTVIGVLVLLVAGVLGLAATKPDVFQVQRSASIKATPEKIFPLINDFRRWAAWSPYENKDPAMKRTYGETTSGQGAVYGWDGNSDVGSGRITIADTSPPSKVRLNLEMFSPFEAHNVVEFTLVVQGDGTNVTTNVTWAMQGKVSYMAKVVHVFFNMDKMVGNDFEAGLANLKAIAEK